MLLPLGIRAAEAAPLPDAPQPNGTAQTGKTSGTDRNPAPTSDRPTYESLYDRVIFPGNRARPWTAKDKFIFAGRQIIEPINLGPAIISAGYGQLSNDDPRYGTDAAAFGERFGTAIIRQDSYRLLADGFMPILFREDPRYYRSGEGSLAKRFCYALAQTFVTRSDGGKTVPNYAGVLGRGVAASLTYAYYPAASANARVVLSTFGTSLGGDAALNAIRELTTEKIYRELQSLHLRFSGQ